MAAAYVPSLERQELDVAPLDAEESDDGLLVVGGRRVMPKVLRRRAVLGVAAVMASALVAAAVFRQQRSQQGSINAAEPIQEFVKPFKKCGAGTGAYDGPSCCQSGCACVIQDEFYSQCEAPGGLQKCNPDHAIAEVSRAKTRYEDTKPNIKKTAQVLKSALIVERAALKEEMKKRLIMRSKIQKGDVAKKKKEAAEELAKQAMDKKKAADEAYEAKVKEFDGLKIAVNNIDRVAETRKTRSAKGSPCPGVFGDCSGDQCCAVGCICIKKDNFYFQCQVPPGKPTCDVGGEEADAKKKRDAMKKLTQQKAHLLKAKESADDAWEEAHKHEKAAEHEANVAGSARVEATHEHDIAVKHLHVAKLKAKRGAAALRRAKMAVGWAFKAIDAWKDAAKGTTCTKNGHKSDKESEDDHQRHQMTMKK